MFEIFILIATVISLLASIYSIIMIFLSKDKTKRKAFTISLITTAVIFFIALSVYLILQNSGTSEERESPASSPTATIEPNPSPSPEPTSNDEADSALYFQNNINAYLILAQNYFNNTEYEEAVKVYMGLIANGIENPIVYNNLGYMCANGYGITQDCYTAEYLYNKAYNHGSTISMGNIICLIGYAPFSSEKYTTILDIAYQQNDERATQAIDEISRLFKTSTDVLDSEDYFNLANSKKNQFWNTFISMYERKTYHDGSCFLWDQGLWLSSYFSFVTINNFNFFNNQKYDYISSDEITVATKDLKTISEYEPMPNLEYAELLVELNKEDEAISIYNELTESDNHIVYNNLGYLYSVGISDEDGNKTGTDYNKAKDGYLTAYELGSSVANGNIIGLMSFIRESNIVLSQIEICDNLQRAYLRNDNRVEQILQVMYYSLNISKVKPTYAEDFFSKTYDDQVSITEQLLTNSSPPGGLLYCLYNRLYDIYRFNIILEELDFSSTSLDDDFVFPNFMPFIFEYTEDLIVRNSNPDLVYIITINSTD